MGIKVSDREDEKVQYYSYMFIPFFVSKETEGLKQLKYYIVIPFR